MDIKTASINLSILSNCMSVLGMAATLPGKPSSEYTCIFVVPKCMLSSSQVHNCDTVVILGSSSQIRPCKASAAKSKPLPCTVFGIIRIYIFPVNDLPPPDNPALKISHFFRSGPSLHRPSQQPSEKSGTPTTTKRVSGYHSVTMALPLRQQARKKKELRCQLQ